MSISKETNNLSSVLFGKSRRAVLALLFTHSDESFYLRRIVRITGIGLGPIQRELTQLTGAGILRRTIKGNSGALSGEHRIIGIPRTEKLFTLVNSETTSPTLG